jgi:inward rectifier potassium channel
MAEFSRRTKRLHQPRRCNVRRAAPHRQDPTGGFIQDGMVVVWWCSGVGVFYGAQRGLCRGLPGLGLDGLPGVAAPHGWWQDFSWCRCFLDSNLHFVGYRHVYPPAATAAVYQQRRRAELVGDAHRTGHGPALRDFRGPQRAIIRRTTGIMHSARWRPAACGFASPASAMPSVPAGQVSPTVDPSTSDQTYALLPWSGTVNFFPLSWTVVRHHPALHGCGRRLRRLS